MHTRVPLALLLLATTAAGQTYIATDLGGISYSSIAGTPAATRLTQAECDDCYDSIGLPFSFLWYGREITRLTVSSNGQLNMDDRLSHHCCSAPTIPAADGNDDAIFFAKEDLYTGTGGLGEVWTVVLGSGTSRRFVIEIAGAPWTSGTPPVVSAQVVLYEQPRGQVEIRWGPGSVPPGNTFSAGVEDAGGTEGTPAIAGSFFDSVGRATSWPANRACRFELQCVGSCSMPEQWLPMPTGVPGGRTALGTIRVDTSACGLDSVAIPCGAGGGADYLIEFVAPFDGSALASTCGFRDYDTALAVLDGGCGSTVLNCNNDSCTLGSRVAFSINTGQTYTVVVDGAAGATGTADVTIDLQEASCTGTCATPEVWIPVPTGPMGSRTAVTTLSGVDTTSCGTDSVTLNCAFGGGDDYLVEFVAPFDGNAVASTCGASTYNSALAALNGGCGSSILDCADDSCGTGAQIAWLITSGSTYTVVVDGSVGATGTVDVTIDLQETGGSCTGTCATPEVWVPVPVGPVGSRSVSDTLFVDTTTCMTDSVGGLSCATDGDDHIIQFTAPFWGTAVIDTCTAASYDTLLAALDGSCGSPELDCSDDFCSTSSQIQFNLQGGNLYTIVVDGWNGRTGSTTLSLALTESGGPACTCGDCNADSQGPNILDALAAAQIAVGLISPSASQMTCCDTTGDLSITVTDSLRIAQVAAGLSVSLSCP